MNVFLFNSCEYLESPEEHFDLFVTGNVQTSEDICKVLWVKLKSQKKCMFLSVTCIYST